MIPYEALEQLEGGPLERGTIEDKVVLVVNVASKCGYTPQYEGLQTLYDRYKDRGFTVVGVPCNQFGGQEPGGSEEIASFCKMRYGVSFPLLVKQDVNGSDRSPFYQFLVHSESAAESSSSGTWQVLGIEGEVVSGGSDQASLRQNHRGRRGPLRSFERQHLTVLLALRVSNSSDSRIEGVSTVVE